MTRFVCLNDNMAKAKKSYNNEYDRVIDEIGEMFRDVIDFSDKRFTRLETRMDKIEGRMGGLEDRMGGLEGRMGGLEKDNTWIKGILEKHTTILKHLDEERIFTLSYVKRLENEIEQIKKHLQIA